MNHDHDNSPNPRAGSGLRALAQGFMVVLGLIGLWFAIEYAQRGNWPVAIVLFVAFGGIEAFAFLAGGLRAPRK